MRHPRSAADWKDLIRRGESEQVEFKLNIPPEHVIAAHLTAFANASGGILLIGVNEKAEIIGLTEADGRRALSTLRKVAGTLLPSATDVDDILIAGKILVYALVDPAPSSVRPILTATGEAYQRRGSSSIQLSDEALRTFLQPDSPNVVTSKRQVKLFIAMSFRTEQEPSLIDYFEAIKRAIKKTDLPIEVVRIDLVDGDFEISAEIMRRIEECEIVLADFTLTPPNVYFEIGYARGCKDREIIQTARQGTKLEFDVRNWRTEFYKNATELEQKIEPAIAAAYGRLTKP
jgi:hypothetical protein